MPLNRGRNCKTKKCKRKAVASNIAELTNANKSKTAGKRRSHEQIIAIAMQTVYGKKRRS